MEGAVVCNRNLVDDIFYHIRQVEARVAKLVTVGALGLHFGGRGGFRRRRWYYSNERWWFPIGSPFHCDHCVISNHSAEIYHQMSDSTISSTGGGPLSHWCKSLGRNENGKVVFRAHFHQKWMNARQTTIRMINGQFFPSENALSL